MLTQAAVVHGGEGAQGGQHHVHQFGGGADEESLEFQAPGIEVHGGLGEGLGFFLQDFRLEAGHLLGEFQRPWSEKHRQHDGAAHFAENILGCRRASGGGADLADGFADGLELLERAHLAERIHVQAELLERALGRHAFLIDAAQGHQHAVERWAKRIGPGAGGGEGLLHDGQILDAGSRAHGEGFEFMTLFDGSLEVFPGGFHPFDAGGQHGHFNQELFQLTHQFARLMAQSLSGCRVFIHALGRLIKRGAEGSGIELEGVGEDAGHKKRLKT